MDVLILGGTRFLGIHIAEELARRGHAATRFTRRLAGDRRTDLGRLGERRWDAVIDTSGYEPRDVEISARYFAARAGAYLFVSTVSVYDARAPFLDEEAAQTTTEPYGSKKAACERIVASTFRERAAIVRPGLIVGPHDFTDRFTYWPSRFAAGGEILAPESPSFATQFVDARDLAAFVVRLVERGRGGVFNATSPPGAIRLGELFAACRAAVAMPSRLRWAPAAFLEEHGVAPWIEMPLWIPASEGMPGFFNVDVRRALAAGLRFRPLRETVRDTLAWARTRKTPRADLRAGLSEERERELLLALD